MKNQALIVLKCPKNSKNKAKSLKCPV